MLVDRLVGGEDVIERAVLPDDDDDVLDGRDGLTVVGDGPNRHVKLAAMAHSAVTVVSACIEVRPRQ